MRSNRKKSYILPIHSRINVVCQVLSDAEIQHNLQNGTAQAQLDMPCEASAFFGIKTIKT